MYDGKQETASAKRGKPNKKIDTISYAKMVALLSMAEVDLEWADGQYWTTLFNVFKEITILRTPKKKQKVTASQMQNFIK